jgi:hypothetical protein
MRIRHTIAIAAAALALAACTPTEDAGSSKSDPKPKASASTAKKTDPKKLDDAGEFACDDFARDYQSAQTSSARIDLANKVNKWAPKSGTDRIADSAIVLARAAEGSASAWQLGADTFAQACLDAGWKP